VGRVVSVDFRTAKTKNTRDWTCCCCCFAPVLNNHRDWLQRTSTPRGHATYAIFSKWRRPGGWWLVGRLWRRSPKYFNGDNAARVIFQKDCRDHTFGYSCKQYSGRKSSRAGAFGAGGRDKNILRQGVIHQFAVLGMIRRIGKSLKGRSPREVYEQLPNTVEMSPAEAIHLLSAYGIHHWQSLLFCHFLLL